MCMYKYFRNHVIYRQYIFKHKLSDKNYDNNLIILLIYLFFFFERNLEHEDKDIQKKNRKINKPK